MVACVTPPFTAAAPGAIQVQSDWWRLRTPSSMPISFTKRTQEMRKEAPTVPSAKRSTTLLFFNLRPVRPLTMKPKRGRKTRRPSRLVGVETACIADSIVVSALQQVHVVHLDRVAPAVERDDQGEAHGDFRGGVSHHQEGDGVAAHGAAVAGQGDEVQVGGVEHELDAHEDHQRVAADEHARDADGEQQEGDEEDRVRGSHQTRSDFARTMAPTSATSRITDRISKGRSHPEKRPRLTAWALLAA